MSFKERQYEGQADYFAGEGCTGCGVCDSVCPEQVVRHVQAECAGGIYAERKSSQA